jgi:hypothetical protein
MEEADIRPLNTETKIGNYCTSTHNTELDINHHETPTEVTDVFPNSGVQAVGNSCYITYFRLV